MTEFGVGREQPLSRIAAKADEAIVLVGGRGTRLQTVVSDLPKPLAPVAGRPFLGWVLDRLGTQGMRRVILATGYLANQIEAFAGRRWQGMQIDYSLEQKPLGTGGAIALAATHLQGSAVHIINGDTFLAYVPAELENAARQTGAAIGVALAHVDDVARYGAVAVRDGRVVAFQEKSGHGAGWINGGSYFLSQQGLAMLERTPPFSFEIEVLVPQAQEGRVAAFCDTSRFIDIGVPEDYARAQSLFGDDA